MPKEKFFTIGEISKLYNIGLDSIRYYEKMGVLSPKRNPENNYRLYTLKDISRLTAIRELMALNFSLEEIKAFYENHNVDSTISMLEKELKSVNENILKLYEAKNSIEARLKKITNIKKVPVTGEISVIEMFERPCIMVSEKNIPDNYVDYSVVKYMKTHSQPISTIGACSCYTLDIENSNPDSDYYRTKNVFFYSEGIHYHSNYTLPAGKYISTYYKGSPKKTKMIMPSLYEYAKRHRLKVIDDPIEFCHIDEYETSDENEYLTELQLPVKSL